ncbi:MAG: endonuclease III [Candidatus Latescibacteria bacterium]|nr:endonuclease III [Candidatus Latescibacterota bacterium]
MRETIEGRKGRVAKIITILKREFPDARCMLNFTNPLELLVATILSAQCTDEQVNKVTVDLFRKYRTAKDYAEAPLEELEQDIRSTGFYRNKARHLQQCCQQLVLRHNGEVPSSMEKLTRLGGVGRKTANVVLGNVFGIPGVAVDTHVRRIVQRLGVTGHDDPDKIEQDLMEVVPKEEWTLFSHLLAFHGRRICDARRPLCMVCPIGEWCPSNTAQS